MEAMQQMNIRISPKLKKEGDSVLARLGLTPSEGIRRMYEFLIRNQNNRRTLNAVINAGSVTDEAAKERERQRQELLDAPCRLSRMATELGIDMKESCLATATKEDLREMYAEAIEERMIERDLL